MPLEIEMAGTSPATTTPHQKNAQAATAAFLAATI